MKLIISLLIGFWFVLVSGCDFPSDTDERRLIEGQFEAVIFGALQMEISGTALFALHREEGTDALLLQLIERSTETSLGISFTGREIAPYDTATYSVVTYEEGFSVNDIEDGEFFAIYIHRAEPYDGEFQSISGSLSIVEVNETERYIRGSFDFDAGMWMENTENQDTLVTVNATGNFIAAEGGIE